MLVLEKAIKSIGQDDATMEFWVVGGQLHAKTFSATWSIKHMSNKGISLDHSDSYDDMIEQASKLTRKQVDVVLEITEAEVRGPDLHVCAAAQPLHQDSSNRQAMRDHGDDIIEQKPEHENGHPKKKQKTVSLFLVSNGRSDNPSGQREVTA